MMPTSGHPNATGQSSGQPNSTGPSSGQQLLRTSSNLLTNSGGVGQPGMGMTGTTTTTPVSGGGIAPFGSLVPPGTPQYAAPGGGNGMLVGASNVASLLGRQSFGNAVGHGATLPPGNGGGGVLPMGTLQQQQTPGNGGGVLRMGALQQRQQRGGIDALGDHLAGSALPDAVPFPSSSTSQSHGGSTGNYQHLTTDTFQQHHHQLLLPDAPQDSQHQQQMPMLLHNQHGMPPQTVHQLNQQVRQPGAGADMENGGVLLGGGLNMDQQMRQPDHNSPAPQMSVGNSTGASRSLGAVRMDRQISDSSVFLQQQQQQVLQLGKQNPQAAAAQLNLRQQQQRFLQLQQQQHQQILKNLPLHRNQLQKQQQQQQQQQQELLRHQSLNTKTPGKSAPYEPGTCAKRLTQYLSHKQNRPRDNSIEFWRNFVSEYFARGAKKRWCVSLYGNGSQTTGVFPQDVWHCEICNSVPGRGFETMVEVLARLNQIKYDSGTLEELLYVDMPQESKNSSGQIVLDYSKAIQETVFEQLRVVREGHLRIVFNQDLKIALWEFCARTHEEIIPRRSIIPQVGQLGAVVQRCQSPAQNSSAVSSQDAQNNCNSFVACAQKLSKALDVPLVNDLGYTKRYVRCLQIAEVVNCMKDLIDFSTRNSCGAIESLHKFPKRRPSGMGSLQLQQQPEEQPLVPQNSNHTGQNSAPATGMQVSASGNGDTTSNNPPNCGPSSSPVASLFQGSMNHIQDPPMNSGNGMHNTRNNASVAMANSTNSMPSNAPASFPSPAPSVSNGSMMPAPQQTRQLNSQTISSNLPPMQTPSSGPQEPEPSDSQSSVERILQELMMQSNMNGAGPVGSDMKQGNAINPGVDSLVGNPMTNNPGINGMGFGAMGGLGQSMRTTGNNSMAMNGRSGVNHSAHDQTQSSHQQQQQERDMGHQLLGGLRAGNSFNNLQYDWKSSQ